MNAVKLKKNFLTYFLLGIGISGTIAFALFVSTPQAYAALLCIKQRCIDTFGPSLSRVTSGGGRICLQGSCIRGTSLLPVSIEYATVESDGVPAAESINVLYNKQITLRWKVTGASYSELEGPNGSATEITGVPIGSVSRTANQCGSTATYTIRAYKYYVSPTPPDVVEKRIQVTVGDSAPDIAIFEVVGATATQDGGLRKTVAPNESVQFNWSVRCATNIDLRYSLHYKDGYQRYGGALSNVSAYPNGTLTYAIPAAWADNYTEPGVSISHKNHIEQFDYAEISLGANNARLRNVFRKSVPVRIFIQRPSSLHNRTLVASSRARNSRHLERAFHVISSGSEKSRRVFSSLNLSGSLTPLSFRSE